MASETKKLQSSKKLFIFGVSHRSFPINNIINVDDVSNDNIDSYFGQNKLPNKTKMERRRIRKRNEMIAMAKIKGDE